MEARFAFEPHAASASTQGIRRRAASLVHRRSVHGAFDSAVLLRPRDSRGKWIRTHRNRYGAYPQRLQAISPGYRWQTAAGVELRILKPDSEGIGEVAVHSKTVMSHYLDDPELTAETIVNGWLLTGDLGRFD